LRLQQYRRLHARNRASSRIRRNRFGSLCLLRRAARLTSSDASSARRWPKAGANRSSSTIASAPLAFVIHSALPAKSVRERFYGQGIEPVYATPGEFAGHIKATVAKYAKVIKALGLKAE
jgi:hypothetical protein